MQLAAAIAIAAALAAGWAQAESRRLLSFQDLNGWAADDHAAALDAFLVTCRDMTGQNWRALCKLAGDAPEPRTFFELFFRPVLIEDDTPPLITGYFEPELKGSRTRSAKFSHPIYSLPPELAQGGPGPSRADILEQNVLAGRGLEIAWVEDVVGLFYMQVQGSGRIRLPDGTILRLGYAGANGHAYRSPGMELVRRGVYQPHQVSARVISSWVSRFPDAGRDLLMGSPSFVFFRVIDETDEDVGPRGAMNRPITAGRTIAVDPRYVRLGAPIWMEKGGQDAIRRLVIAQDTGGAIKGAQRADFFLGSGEEAGLAAAKLKDRGRLIQLLPIDTALGEADR